MLSLLGEDPLLGPLSQLKGDAVDSAETDLDVDEQRLQPRSDDEDTLVAPSLAVMASTHMERAKHTVFTETLRKNLCSIGWTKLRKSLWSADVTDVIIEGCSVGSSSATYALHVYLQEFSSNLERCVEELI